MPIQRVAVLGAGGGGRASAYHLASRGLTVNLWEAPAFETNLADLRGGLTLDGDPSPFAPLGLVTTDLAAAIAGVELIVACVQRPAHRMIASELAQHMSDDQMLLLNPGSLGGALEIAEIFLAAGRRRPLIGETSTLAHCARPTTGGVRILLEVEFVRFAAFPAANTQTMLAALQPLYPFFAAAHSVLETGLYNGNPVLHPAIALLNAAAIERNDGSFRFYGDGMSPAVAKVIEAVDRERQALGRAFGFDLLPEPIVSQRQQYGPTDDYLTCYRDSKIFGPLVAPNTLDHRYMHEDVGEGLITWLALGEVAGVPLPAVEALVTLAETVTGRDYRAQKAERLQRLGLVQKDLAGMQKFVLAG
ncbi:MAG: NAD/NADP octopine/nopaline dehydrogenase family protein [Armatimonadota bacterium]